MMNQACENVTLPFAMLTIEECCAMLKMHRVTFYRKLQLGIIGPEPIRFGPRCIRFSRTEMEAWYEAGCPRRAKWEVIRAAQPKLRGFRHGTGPKVV
jgi:excisionase family DNA binding protein